MPKRIIQNVHIYRLDISKHSYAWGSVQKVPVEKQSVQIKCQDLKDNTTLTEVTFRQQLQKTWLQYLMSDTFDICDYRQQTTSKKLLSLLIV